MSRGSKFSAWLLAVRIGAKLPYHKTYNHGGTR